MWVKDFKRTIDYLETRPDTFDISRLAFEGLSWGGTWAGILPAIDSRIKVTVALAPGLGDLDWPQEYHPVNFAPQIKIPVLLQGGKYDSLFPVETGQKPFFSLFGTAGQDKHYKTYDTGHSISTRNQAARDELEFLDKYLGPAR